MCFGAIIPLINIIRFMPELPEVETVVRELNRKLKNKTVKSVSVLLGKIISLGPGTVSNLRKTSQKKIDQFVSEIKGQKIKSVKRRAKLLIFEFYLLVVLGNEYAEQVRGEAFLIRAY